MQDAESFAKGKALFQSGLLSEAVLALEAEVQREPQNVDAWRLLGTVHAENDDDQQVPSSACHCVQKASVVLSVVALGRHSSQPVEYVPGLHHTPHIT